MANRSYLALFSHTMLKYPKRFNMQKHKADDFPGSEQLWQMTLDPKIGEDYSVMKISGALNRNVYYYHYSV